MQQERYRIESNRKLAEGIYRMTLLGDTSAFRAPGQFADLKLEGFFLRRPISVCDWEEGRMTLIYKAVGRGTEAMTRLTAGEELDVLSGLGNGYNTAASGERPLLIGGGAGVPPLYRLCRELLAQGKHPRVILGFNTAAEAFYTDEFRRLFAEKADAPKGNAGDLDGFGENVSGTETTEQVDIVTADGSLGHRGFVTDKMKELTDYTYFYACGPMPMFRAIEAIARTDGQYSFEERMGCGFGACMGCSCQTQNGPRRICREGPVFGREEIIWEN